MGEHTKIEWATHTFNPWRGCTNVSPGCDHCYAEAGSKRNPGLLGVWGDDGTRVVASEAYWRKPLAWDKRAAAAGERHRVFCASLADVFEDRADLVLPRLRLFQLIAATPNLDWLLLTKRPACAQRMLTANRYAIGNFPQRLANVAGPVDWPLPNVWLGVTAEDQERADERIPILLDTPAAVRFVSYEPALGPVDFGAFLAAEPIGYNCERDEHDWSGPDITDPCLQCGRERDRSYVDWIIVGGESGPHARTFDIEWARDAIAQGRTAGVPVFVKQLGANPVERQLTGGEFNGRTWLIDLASRKGGNPDEWPEDLRVREIPGAR